MRLLLKTLLVLHLVAAQMAAPLVHAHVGGDPDAGKPHLPGLEALAAPARHIIAQQDDARAHQPGLAVGIATGLQFKPIHNPPAPCLAILAPPLRLDAFIENKLIKPPSPAFPASSPPRLEQASPRAPPAGQAL